MILSKFSDADRIVGLGKAHTDTESQEFRDFRKIILQHSEQQSLQQRIENELLGLRAKLEKYQNTPLLNKTSLIETGQFLQEYLNTLKISVPIFARYLDCSEIYLKELYHGKKKMDKRLAVKLGKVFNTPPSLWLNIQIKNELWKLEQLNKKEYEKYNFTDLIELRAVTGIT